jgi:hypothetical protein
MNLNDFPRVFGRSLRSGSASVLCGAGISVPSGLPGWSDLLAETRADLGLGEDFSDLSMLATYFVSTIPGGRTRLVKMIHDHLSGGEFRPNDIHHALWQLPVSYIWSLNFDRLLEDAFPNGSSPPLRVIDSDDAMTGSLMTQGRSLIKIHGGLRHLEADDGKRLVVTRDDFDTYITEFPRTWTRLLADFHTKSMLFVGISFADPNMQTLLRIVRNADRAVTPQHYAIVRKPDGTSSEEVAKHNLQRADLRRGGVESVEIDDFDELPSVLRRAAIYARRPVVMLSGSLPEGDSHLHNLRTLGVMLASVSPNVDLVHGGSRTLMPCIRSFVNMVESLGTYSENRVVQVRRSVTPNDLEVHRLGTVVFPGAHAKDVRRELCSRAAICLVIGGEEQTAREVEECQKQGIRVVPLPLGIGYSQQMWERLADLPPDSESAAVAAMVGDDEAIVDHARRIVTNHLFA